MAPLNEGLKMTSKLGIFIFNDRLKMVSLNHRLKRSEVIHSNIANVETPGFRSLGYGFEEQLQSISNSNESIEVRTSNPRHKKHPLLEWTVRFVLMYIYDQ